MHESFAAYVVEFALGELPAEGYTEAWRSTTAIEGGVLGAVLTELPAGRYTLSLARGNHRGRSAPRLPHRRGGDRAVSGRYPVPAGRARAEEAILRSRFITTAGPVADMEAAAFVASVRAEFPDATHNCYAFSSAARLDRHGRDERRR